MRFGGEDVDFGAYALSTVDGFKFIPFGDQTIRNILSGNESLLDLDSALGLRVGSIIMRYQRLTLGGQYVHAYSIYKGALEQNAGRVGTFIGLTLVFSARINAKEINLGTYFRELIDGLANLVIKDDRFFQQVDLKSVDYFCNETRYSDVLLAIGEDSRPLAFSPAQQTQKNRLFHTKHDLGNAFNAICEDPESGVEFHIMQATAEQISSSTKVGFTLIAWPPVKSKQQIATNTTPSSRPKAVSTLQEQTYNPYRRPPSNSNESALNFTFTVSTGDLAVIAGIIVAIFSLGLMLGILINRYYSSEPKLESIATDSTQAKEPRSSDMLSKRTSVTEREFNTDDSSNRPIDAQNTGQISPPIPDETTAGAKIRTPLPSKSLSFKKIYSTLCPMGLDYKAFRDTFMEWNQSFQNHENDENFFLSTNDYVYIPSKCISTKNK